LKKDKMFLLTALAFFVLLLLLFNDFIFDNSKLMLNSDQIKGVGSRYVRS
jgi:hypothetical protein